MAKKVTEELKTLISTLKSFPRGALIEEIESKSELGLERRTLQRRLTRLEQEGAVTVSGHSRATRYELTNAGQNLVAKGTYFGFAPADGNPQEGVTGFSTYDDLGVKKGKFLTYNDLLPLSKAGKDMQALVARPLQHRKPVSYNRDFLEAYKPNVSFYLSLAEREKLEKTGKTAMPDQPAGTYAKEILNRLLIDLSWNSSRLEGNTYSLLDTQQLISFGKMADDKSATEAQMILNHKDAIEFLVQSTEDIGFNRYTILNLHALLSNNLLPDPAASGRLRSAGVGINRSVYEPLAIPQLISELFDLFLEKTAQIQNPFEQAFFVMVHLPYLQPFDDVNKRVSRLAANIPFIRHNLSPLSFTDVPDDVYIQGMIGIYELNRIELLRDVFLWAYDRSAARYAALRQSLGEPDPFRLKYRETLRELISSIVSQGIKPKEASEKIKSTAKELPEPDQKKFIETVETELLSLHEGNFVRYRIRPSEFKNWKEVWSKANEGGSLTILAPVAE